MIPAYLGGRPVPAARPFVQPAAAHLRDRFVLYGYAPPTEARVAGELFQTGTRGRPWLTRGPSAGSVKRQNQHKFRTTRVARGPEGPTG